MMSTHSLPERNQTLSVLSMSFRRNKTTTITTLVLLIVTLPVILFVQAVASSANAFGGNEVTPEMAEAIFTSLVTFLTLPISLITLILSAGLMFGYLHQKPALDVFHALPVRRLPMFFGRFFGGFLAVMIPQFIAFALVLILRLMPDVRMLPAGVVVGTALATFLMSLAVYAVSVLAFTLTGTIFDALFLIVLLNAAYPATLATIEFFMTLTLPGYAVEMSAIQDRYLLVAPIARFFALGYLHFDLLETLWWLLLTAIMAGGAALYFRHRKSEMAGIPFACKAPFLITRFLATLVVGMFFGYLFYQIRGTLGLYAVGVLIGSITTHLVIEVILSRGFRSFGRSLVSYGLYLLVFTIGCAIVVFGFFGYDYRLPAQTRIVSIELSNEDLRPAYEADGSMQYPVFQDPENIDLIFAMHQAWIDQLKQLAPRPYSLTTTQNLERGAGTIPLDVAQVDENGNMVYGYRPASRIAYTLSNGTIMVRRVYIDYQEEPYTALVKRLEQTDEYTVQKYVSLFQPAVMIGQFSIADKLGQNYFSLNGQDENDRARIVRLQEALKADILAGKVEMADAAFLGTLVINGNAYYATDSQIVLTDAFTQTIAAMADLNLAIDPSAMSGRFDAVYIGINSNQLSAAMEMNSIHQKAAWDGYYLVQYYPYGELGSPALTDPTQFIKVDDRALIDQLYQSGVSSWPDLNSGYLLAFATPGQVDARGMTTSGPLPVLHLPAEQVPAELAGQLGLP